MASSWTCQASCPAESTKPRIEILADVMQTSIDELKQEIKKIRGGLTREIRVQVDAGDRQFAEPAC